MWLFRESASNQAFMKPVVKNTFPRYLKIIQNQVFARYLLAKHMEIDKTVIKKDDEDQLWEEHDRISSEFRDNIHKWDGHLKEVQTKQNNYLNLKIRLATLLESPCRICERNCERKRQEGEVGFCLVPEKGSIASTFLHPGEEIVLIPSGTIFFNGCTFRCVFCQNWDIAHTKYLSEHEIVSKLTQVESNLTVEGARNLNYVGGDPSPNLKNIFMSWKDLHKNVTQLFNSNHYLSELGITLIQDIFDFWLPDFKYWDNEFAFKVSKVKNYRETLTRNLKRCFEYGSGEMIIRHLVLPERVEKDTKPILKWIKEELDPYGTVMVNIMAQYHPDYLVPKDDRYQELNRRVSKQEMRSAFNYAKELDLKYKIVS